MSKFEDVLKKSKGYGAFEEREKQIEEGQKDRAFRFWLPPEKGSKIIFLDDDPVILEEHQIKIKGDWKNWFTCARVTGEPCLICDKLGDLPSTVGYYTILDLSSYTDSKGNERSNTVKLLAPKFRALQMLKRASAKRGGLELWVVDVYRTTEKAYNVGDVYDFEEKTTWDKVKELNSEAKVLDYAELLKPKPQAHLRQLLMDSTESSNDAGVDEVNEDEIDF